MTAQADTSQRPYLSEARTLLRYLGERQPTPLQLRCYEEAAAQFDRPLRIPAFILAFPPLLRLIEPLGRTRLSERLFVASLLLEVSPAGAKRLYDYSGEGRPLALLRLVAISLAEALAMPFRLVLGRLWRP